MLLIGRTVYRVKNLLQPIRSTTQNWLVTPQHYGISVLDPKTSFRGKPTEWWQREMGVFSQATLYFTILGPVVRRPIGATPELNFKPGFFFPCSNAFSRIICNFVEHPMNKLRIKISKLNLLLKLLYLHLKFRTSPGLS